MPALGMTIVGAVNGEPSDIPAEAVALAGILKATITVDGIALTVSEHLARRALLLRQGSAELPDAAAVDGYTGPLGAFVATPKGPRAHDGVTPGGLRLIAEQYLASTALTLPSGVTDALGTLLSLASDFVVAPLAGDTVTVPAGVARLVVRGGAPHFRLALPAPGAAARLRIEIEDGTRQSRPKIQCVPTGTDQITDGLLPVARVPLTIEVERTTALSRTAGVWTIGDAAAPLLSFKFDPVNGIYRYGYIAPVASRTLAQMITFTVGAGSTVIGADGVCRDAPANVLREVYDPTTLAYLGALFEGYETKNWLANASSAAGPAYTANAVASPAIVTDLAAVGLSRFYGVSAIHKITPDGNNSYCGSLPTLVPAGSMVCLSLRLWIPAACSGTTDKIFEMRCVTPGITEIRIVGAAFGLRDCWQRVWIVVLNTTNADITADIRLNAYGIRSVGDEQYPFRDMYISCGMIERDTDFPSSFVPNGSATVPAVRAADTVAFLPGLILDTLAGFTIAAETITPALPQCGESGAVGIGADAAGSTAAVRLLSYGEGAQPYAMATVSGAAAPLSAPFLGSAVVPGRPSRAAVGVAPNDFVYEDSGGGRVTRSVGLSPDEIGRIPFIDAKTPVIVRSLEVYRAPIR